MHGERLPKSIPEQPEFDPRSNLDAIKATSPASKREVVRKYTERLMYQLEGIVDAQAVLREHIHTRPDSSFAQLVSLWEEETSQLGLAPWQKKLARDAITKYVAIHNAVEDVREKHPDDRDLYRHIFNTEPSGEIQIEEGPMTLYFRCTNDDDYANIYFYGARHISARMLETARMSVGISIRDAPTQPLRGAIIAERGRRTPGESERIRTHEEQHAYRRLFSNTLTPLSPPKQKSILNDEARLTWLKQFCRYLRIEGEHRMSDEVLAYLKDGSTKESILRTLTNSQSTSRLYDYFDFPKTYVRRYMSSSNTELTEEAIKAVFVDEYRVMIHDAIDAVQDVINQGFTIEEAIDYFTMLPVSHWGKWSKRLIANIRNVETVLPNRKQYKENRFMEKYDQLASEFDVMPYIRPKKHNKRKR